MDLFLATAGYRAEVVSRAVRREVGGIGARVARCEDLILLKCLAARPIDLADAKALFSIHRDSLDSDDLERRVVAPRIVDRPWRA